MLAALDLFAGAGGFSLGLRKAGINVVGAIELDRFAAETYRTNFPGATVYEVALETRSSRWLKTKFSGVDIIAGGPPCQGFSVAGPSQYRILDARNSLVLEMARVIKVIRPKFAVLENVKGILSGKISSARLALDAYIEMLHEAGYHSKIVRLQAANFGVPQLRERVFVLSTIGAAHLLDANAASLTKTRGTHITSGECFSDLPPVSLIAENNALAPYSRPPQNAFQKNIRLSSPGVMNHIPMKHTARILARLRTLGHGESMRDVSKEFGQRRRNSSELDAGQRFKMNCTRIDPDKPSLSVPANFQTIHVHPFEDRMLTAREGARLQGFPDAFKWMPSSFVDPERS